MGNVDRNFPVKYAMRNGNSPLDGPTGVIEGFLRHRLDLSEQSRVLYRRVLLRLVTWMRESGVEPIASKVTVDLAEQYIEARVLSIKLSSARTEASVLKSLGHYLGSRVVRGPSPLAKLRLPSPPEGTRRAISDRELAALIRAAAQGQNGTRNVAIVRVAAGCGLRRSELIHLHVGDVDWNEGQLIVRGETSKSKRNRRPTLWPEVGDAIDAYLADRPGAEDPESPLFLARGNHGFKPQGLAAVFRVLAERSGIHDLTAHMLRHTWATNYLRKGSGDLIDMSHEAGWNDKQNRMAWRYSHEKPISERRRRPSPFSDLGVSAIAYIPRRRRRTS